MNELQIALQQLHAANYPAVTGIDPQRVQRLYHLAKALAPKGIFGAKFLPLPLGETTWELRLFTERGSNNDVEFSLFYPGTRYSRQTFIVYVDGRVERSVGGETPSSDIRPNEPTAPAVPELLTLALEVIKQQVSS